MSFNLFKTVSLNRRAYFGWSMVVLAVFALLAPVAHTLSTRTGDFTFAIIYVMAFGAAFGFLNVKRVADFGGQAELWLMAIFVATFCEASPFYEPTMSADAATVMFQSAACVWGAVYLTLLIRPGKPISVAAAAG
jgi:uncharacterized membrane protein YhaH (DUF805 family)